MAYLPRITHSVQKDVSMDQIIRPGTVLEGHGEIWRDDGVESCITALVPGTAIDIPTGTAFQYRNVSDVDLKFICIAMPPWPGDSEATYVKGKWQPTI
jgi:mannose-6-phosphate isomerase-like protein (cupin superfamily)